MRREGLRADDQPAPGSVTRTDPDSRCSVLEPYRGSGHRCRRGIRRHRSWRRCAKRQGRELQEMRPSGGGKQRLGIVCPASRGLIGYHGEFMTETRGTGHHEPACSSRIRARQAGPIAGAPRNGRAGIDRWSAARRRCLRAVHGAGGARATLMIGSGNAEVYAGMIIGEHSAQQRPGGQSAEVEAADQRSRIGYR